MKLEQKPVSEETQPTIEDLQRQVLDLKTEFLALDRLVGTTRTEQANLASTVAVHYKAMKSFDDNSPFYRYADVFIFISALSSVFRLVVKTAFWLSIVGFVWFIATSLIVYLFPSLSPAFYEFMTTTYTYSNSWRNGAIEQGSDYFNLVLAWGFSVFFFSIFYADYSLNKRIISNNFKFFP